MESLYKGFNTDYPEGTVQILLQSSLSVKIMAIGNKTLCEGQSGQCGQAVIGTRAEGACQASIMLKYLQNRALQILGNC